MKDDGWITGTWAMGFGSWLVEIGLLGDGSWVLL